MAKPTSGKPEIVIALYKPKPGREKALVKTLEGHLPALRKAKLVTKRPAILMKAADGTLLEVFEWRSERHSGLAHEHPGVVPVWEAIGRDAEFATLGGLSEAKTPFPHFEPVEI